MSRTIVVPTDFSEVSREAFPFAADLAHRFEASIALVHVLPALARLVATASPRFSDYEEAVLEQANVELEKVSGDPAFAGLEVETVMSMDPPAAPAVLDVVEETSAALIVMSNHGRRGAARLLLGSVTEEIVRTAPVPVLTVGDDSSLWKAGQRLLVPIDFSPTSLHALEAAARLSRLLELEVHLAHVIEPPQAPVLLKALPEIAEMPREELEVEVVAKLEKLAKSVGLGDRFQVVSAVGNAKENILRFAESLEPALIVIGSHGRRGLGRVVLGSVAEGVVRTSRWPTLVVKSGECLDQWPGCVPRS